MTTSLKSPSPQQLVEIKEATTRMDTAIDAKLRKAAQAKHVHLALDTAVSRDSKNP